MKKSITEGFAVLLGRVGDEVLPDALGGEACVLDTVEYRMCLPKACFAVWVVAFMGT